MDRDDDWLSQEGVQFEPEGPQDGDIGVAVQSASEEVPAPSTPFPGSSMEQFIQLQLEFSQRLGTLVDDQAAVVRRLIRLEERVGELRLQMAESRGDLQGQIEKVRDAVAKISAKLGM